mmetsp:Transcript_2913/g.7493  ORF Transcript_2913/g.7493 Transcript_2913/m.7493 type:complete len:273 (+) Transcript_2913:599-1417(+)
MPHQAMVGNVPSLVRIVLKVRCTGSAGKLFERLCTSTCKLGRSHLFLLFLFHLSKHLHVFFMSINVFVIVVVVNNFNDLRSRRGWSRRARGISSLLRRLFRLSLLVATTRRGCCTNSGLVKDSVEEVDALLLPLKVQLCTRRSGQLHEICHNLVLVPVINQITTTLLRVQHLVRIAADERVEVRVKGTRSRLTFLAGRNSTWVLLRTQNATEPLCLLPATSAMSRDLYHNVRLRQVDRCVANAGKNDRVHLGAGAERVQDALPFRMACATAN